MVRLEGASLGELCVRSVVKRHIRPHLNILQYQYPKAHRHIMHLMESGCVHLAQSWGQIFQHRHKMRSYVNLYGLYTD